VKTKSASGAASEAAQSFEDTQCALDQALMDSFGMDQNGFRRYCLVETFPDYVIARGPDGDLYQINCTLGANGDSISFSNPQAVETAYVPVQEAVRFLAAEAAAAPGDGMTWPIQVMQSGFAHGAVLTGDPALARLPHYFPANVVAEVAEACKSARFGRRHPETDVEESDAARIAGWLDDGRMESGAARATMHLFPNETEISGKLGAARDAGKLDLFGASILAYFAWKPGKAEGREALVAQKLGRLVSVDMVTEAGAGGKILPYAASRSVLAEISALQKIAIKQSSPGTTGREHGGVQAGRTGGEMKPIILKVLEALRRHDAGRADELQKEFEKLPEEKYAEFSAKAVEALTVATAAAAAAPAAEAKEVLAKAQEAIVEAKSLKFAASLEKKLADSKLPVPAQALVRERFTGGIAEDPAVDAYIVKTREAFAQFVNVGKLNGSTVSVGLDTRDKVQLAMDAMLGVKEARKDPNVRPFRGIQEAYIHCTGDRDLSLVGRGGLYRVSEAIAAADFPNVLLDSMTKRLIQDYAELAINDQLDMLYTAVTLSDYKTQNRIRMGYLPDLSSVAEAGPYTEIAKATDEKITYAVAKRGNVVTISEETIRNDDTGKIAQYPARLARAGRHTLAAFISAFFSSPPTYIPDSVALFHATHTNLGAVALSAAELDVRSIALAKQSEKDSTNRLGLRLFGLMVPVDLRPTALDINGVNAVGNHFYQYFGANNERIIVNPLLTDVNDWYGFSDPAAAPFLEIGFLDGYRTPQIFIANLATQGTSFTNDQIQYKVKFVFGGAPIDFRGIFKEVV
jgi:hypothetical protein